MKAEPPALPGRDDIVVKSGDASPESCLPTLEMRSSLAGGGLVPTGKIFKTTKTTVNEPILQFYSTKEKNSKKEISKDFDSIRLIRQQYLPKE